MRAKFCPPAKGAKLGDYLTHVAQQYSMVEVDSTFYHFPRPSMVQGWYDNQAAARLLFLLRVKFLPELRGRLVGTPAVACILCEAEPGKIGQGGGIRCSSGWGEA